MVPLFFHEKTHKQLTDSGERFNSGRVEAANCFVRDHAQRTLRRALDQVHLCEPKAAFAFRKDKNKPQILRCGPRTARRAHRIREEIIGRARSIFALRFVRRRRHDLSPLLFQKPSGHHCRSKLLHPLVQDRAGLLSQIGCKSESREFVTLQRIARSRQQEFPRRTSVVSGHVISPE